MFQIRQIHRRTRSRPQGHPGLRQAAVFSRGSHIRRSLRHCSCWQRATSRESRTPLQRPCTSLHRCRPFLNPMRRHVSNLRKQPGRLNSLLLQQRPRYLRPPFRVSRRAQATEQIQSESGEFYHAKLVFSLSGKSLALLTQVNGSTRDEGPGAPSPTFAPFARWRASFIAMASPGRRAQARRAREHSAYPVLSFRPGDLAKRLSASQTRRILRTLPTRLRKKRAFVRTCAARRDQQWYASLPSHHCRLERHDPFDIDHPFGCRPVSCVGSWRCSFLPLTRALPPQLHAKRR